jgi:ribonuclease Z
MQKSTGLVQVDEIYVTHFHADHYLGVPGLLKTYDLNGREQPLRVIGPPGLIDLFSALRRIFGKLGYEVELVELEPGEGVRHDGYEVRPFPVEHRMTAYGYALVGTRGRGTSIPRPRPGSAFRRGPSSASSSAGRRFRARTESCAPTT